MPHTHTFTHMHIYKHSKGQLLFLGNTPFVYSQGYSHLTFITIFFIIIIIIYEIFSLFSVFLSFFFFCCCTPFNWVRIVFNSFHLSMKNDLISTHFQEVSTMFKLLEWVIIIQDFHFEDEINRTVCRFHAMRYV